MTVRQLLDLLSLVPADCQDLPVYADGDAGSFEVRVVEISPPNNGDGVEPHISLMSALDRNSIPAVCLIENRRLPGA